ncbi:hypothetical protein [Poseidonocella sp. HB161398]|uniref:hypothetical protein n=1 Tax=Poseidonocella sp. HB161398 TaxID=2320855 RepID=UPI0011084575|nr:hypothetical protein [Poseidonocella sp. HB161398]
MTKKKASPGLFREAPQKPKSPFEKTAAAAKLILESEASARAEQTAKLKAARLARDTSSSDQEE